MVEGAETGDRGLVGELQLVRGYGVVSEVQVASWPAERTPGSYPNQVTAVVRLAPSATRPAVRVHVQYQMVRGVLEPVLVTFSAHGSSRSLSGVDLRRLDLARVGADCREALECEQHRRLPGQRLSPELLRVRQRGRRGYPITHYGTLARRFVELCGEPRVIERLAGEADVSVKTIERWIYTARDKGLLTSRGQGRQGGELTEACEKLLADYEHYDRKED